MTAEVLVQLAQFGATVIGCLGVAVAMRSHRRQMNAQMFLEFSARFQALLRGMPSHVWRKPAADEAMPPPSEELTKNCLHAFHVLADLYHLHKGGYISHELWRPWSLGIRRTLQNPILQREWLAVRELFSHTPAFCRFVHSVIEEGRVTKTRSGSH